MKVRPLVAFAVPMLFLCTPLLASATTSFEISGWLPYWRAASSTADAIAHINELTEVDPFVYSVQNDGTISDLGPMDQSPWTDLVAAARAAHVRVIPTVMWSNASAEEAILSNTTKRVALEVAIVSLVKANNWDGIDIDFEGKPADLKDDFSTFLKGLYQRMGNKFVTCDIEARTPLEELYYGTTVPDSAGEYANDYVQINKYCDRVHLMTYDQQNADMLLNAQAASSSQLYAPVADPQWVSNVVQLAVQTINPSKISIGVPTYGYEYDVTAYANNQYTYDIMWTFNPGYATQIEQQYNVQPIRNAADELYLTYTPNATSTMPVSSNINNALIAAAAASQYATTYNSHLDFRLLDWPDGTSVKDKADLAKDLGLRGIAIFKIDGGEDPSMWTAIAGLAKPLSTTPSASSAPMPTQNTTVTSSASLTRNLDVGSTGADVKTLQQILNSDPATQIASSGPGSPGQETTMFGSLTKLAVEKFQLKYGITTASNPAYGYVGPATRAKLNSILAGM
ncbi:MAG TPA: glycosyl hydrolase family 18 protein [Candidatus Paceibacterota bacterium]|nr:glycosyl hydrolase family 18 protein [Candidatus Paceibacterota bacterium]